MKNPLDTGKRSFQKTYEAYQALTGLDTRQGELDVASLQRAHVALGQAIVEAQKESLADCFDFGEALTRMKDGKRVSRRGWNGKNAWIFVTIPAVTVDEATHGIPWDGESSLDNSKLVRVAPAIAMRTVRGETIVGWLASQTDMLAEDWYEVVTKAVAVDASAPEACEPCRR